MRRSYRLCRFSQNSPLVPKKLPKRNAVSIVIARCPLRIPVIRVVGTVSWRANSAALIPSASSSSTKCSPGCMAVITRETKKTRNVAFRVTKEEFAEIERVARCRRRPEQRVLEHGDQCIAQEPGTTLRAIRLGSRNCILAEFG